MVKTVIRIDGMMCGHCEAHINDTLRNGLGVSKVKSNHKKGETVVQSPESLDEAKVKSLIDATGYTFVSMTEE